MKSKKGFTLIELLAVIVILAIIALIAVPIVLKIIDNAKESSVERSAELYIDAVEKAVARKNLNDEFNPKSCVIEEQKLICEEEEIKIEVKGSKANCGTIEFEKGKIESYTLYIDGYEVKNKNNKITITKSEKCLTSETKTNVAEPELYNGTLTPVVYKNNNWVVADPTKEWYNYEKQEWANAVILGSGISKKVGETVAVEGDNPEALAMFVWIPRYSYTIGNTYGVQGYGGSSPSLSTPGAIDIKFVDTDTKEEGIAAYTGETPSEWRTHPAFTFGNKELSGIWVGKFEPNHTSNSLVYDNFGCSTETCTNADGIRILPNLKSIKNNNLSNQFYAVRSMSRSGNPFKIDANETNSHMMKNSEWGAVAYLTQSKYGKYGNTNYEGANKEVYINNSSGYYTGRSGGSYGGNTAINTVYKDQTSTTQYNTYGFYTYDGYLLSYNTNKKTETRDLTKIASTTGNITGIYDMVGGMSEYVMGVFADSNGNIYTGSSSGASNSGFTGKLGDGTSYTGAPLPNEKYYDLYKAKTGTKLTRTEECNGGICYGHALSETNTQYYGNYSWYNDFSYPVYDSFPWYERGGSYSSKINRGIFYFNDTIGFAASSSFRVVLSQS